MSQFLSAKTWPHCARTQENFWRPPRQFSFIGQARQALGRLHSLPWHAGCGCQQSLLVVFHLSAAVPKSFLTLSFSKVRRCTGVEAALKAGNWPLLLKQSLTIKTISVSASLMEFEILTRMVTANRFCKLSTVTRESLANFGEASPSHP